MSRRADNRMPLVDRQPTDRVVAAEVRDGLTSRPATLPCKLLYDEPGSQLFDRICELPEYYPTRTETAILRRWAPAMAEAIGPACVLIEPGSGTSEKTRLLLDHLRSPAAYVPIDIARDHLVEAAAGIAKEYAPLPVAPVCADYTNATMDEALPLSETGGRRVIFFPGSTLGNFEPDDAGALLGRMARLCGQGGGMVIGVDVRKDPATLHAAYNDHEGVTAAFNRNILHRLNRELGCGFHPDRWWHHAPYDEARGRVEMTLRCQEEEQVRVGTEVFRFRHGETIRTERSYKRTRPDFAAMARETGWEPKEVWTDERELFTVWYLEVR